MKLTKKIVQYIQGNKFLLTILIIYLASMLSVIGWGIPNKNHPFNYHMDEWHQLQAIRAVFQYGSPNIEGAANGTMFQFLLSGFYLIPFVVLKIVNPFVITSITGMLEMQERLFIVLRINTLFFGILSLITLNNIMKKYFNVSSSFSLLFFMITPIWLSLSNYFKYDIALVFWILVSINFLLRFSKFPTMKNYLLAGFFCALSIGTKISALPLVPIYIIAFFLFYLKPLKKIKKLIAGFIVFTMTFLILGAPDLILQKGSYSEYLSSNLIRDPITFNDIILSYKPWWLYIIVKVIPLNFGYLFSAFFLITIIFYLRKIITGLLKKKPGINRIELFIFISMVFFVISLIPLQLGANGNRLLVLLPFFAILSGLFVNEVVNKMSRFWRKIIFLGFWIIVFIQCYQSFAMIVVKWLPDPRYVSSRWIMNNIPSNSTIGIENIPIYQLLPDVVVSEFYKKENDKKLKTNFNYEIIDSSVKTLPKIVIVTNKEYDLNYVKTSPKKLLLERLYKEKYKQVYEIKSPIILYKIMNNDLGIHFSGLVPIKSISIFKK